MALLSFTSRPVLSAALVAAAVLTAVLLALPFVIGGGKEYPIAPADHISSWSWQGAYADHDGKQKEVEAELARLKTMLGKGGSGSDYDIYVGFASEYELLGDGRNAYLYLSKAIAKDPSRGLAYLNMGHLMEELGALETARKAYDAAAAAEPGNRVYQSARSNFYLQHPVPST